MTIHDLPSNLTTEFILWEDTVGTTGSWEAGAGDIEPTTIATSGMLIRETPDHIVLAQSVDLKAHNYDQVLAIPIRALLFRCKFTPEKRKAV